MAVGQIDGVVRDLLLELGLIDAQDNPIAGALDGISNAVTGQLAWDTGLGAISHIVGPSDGFFNIDSANQIRIRTTSGNTDITLASSGTGRIQLLTTGTGFVNISRTQIGGSGEDVILESGDGVQIASDNPITFSLTTLASGTKDVGIARNAAGILEVFDGITPGTFRDLRARNLLADDLDTGAAGALAIGGTTATSVALGRSGQSVGVYGASVVQAAAYARNATIVEDRTLLASASATIINNNNVLAALIADLQAFGVLG